MLLKTTKVMLLFAKRFLAFCLMMVLIKPQFAISQNSPRIINDITQLNPIMVSAILSPKTTSEIMEAVRHHPGPVSIGGGRYSMGGQTATDSALHIDMRGFDSILAFSASEKWIRVQSGITWRKIQEYIDPHQLSVRIMQTYANFTVGGSLSVNVHGRYMGQGPIISSIKEIQLVLANGDTVRASGKSNAHIFYGAIGGYGGLGIITEATLSLTDNEKIERTDYVMPISQYYQYFINHIRNDSTVVFHNADIYPNAYKSVREISYRKTNRNITVAYRLKPLRKKYRFNQFVFRIISGLPGGKWLRQHVIDPVRYRSKPVEWRNYEASYDVNELEPGSRQKSTYVLQEYFVPIEKFDAFYPQLSKILKKYNVNALNISIRHSKKDPGSVMAWARTEVFAFVLYYKQGVSTADKDLVRTWTRDLVDAAIACEGTYYLPYQIHATREQFQKAYPESHFFFELKHSLDPTYKFRNKLWDSYYQ